MACGYASAGPPCLSLAMPGAGEALSASGVPPAAGTTALQRLPTSQRRNSPRKRPGRQSAVDVRSVGATGTTGTVAPASVAGTVATVAGLTLLFSRWRARRRRQTLQEGIATFYDASSGVWIEIWGEHMHHGYYEKGFKGSLEEHKKAQVAMIEEVLRWAEVPDRGAPGAPMSILDVGCGVGGASRHLQRKYGGTTCGITLSPIQRDKAQQFSEETGQGDQCTFQVADALNMPFEDNSFDMVWSLESGEHMPDKATFMREMHRVCKPGGRIILVTWVHRNLAPKEALKPGERRLLAAINKAYHLPEWCSIADYAQIATEQLNISDVHMADWTENIAPFWGAVIRTAIQPRGWWAMARGGWQTFRGAMVMPLMHWGYQSGTIKFGLLTGLKKEAAGAAASTPVVTAAAALFSRRKRSTLRASAREPDQASSASLGDRLVTLWDFTRPHTLIGTLLSVPMVHIFAAAPYFDGFGVQGLARLALAIGAALLPALLVNVYITGLNQIYDVEVDKVNKPYLPLASGRLTLPQAWLTVSSCLLAAVTTSWLYPAIINDKWLHLTLAGSAILGTAYSAPPFRLKRWPFFAALCIVVVRGLVVNLGFYLHAMKAMGLPSGSLALGLDDRGVFAALFFAAFGFVIALLKDVPDVLGDRIAGLRSFSVRLGPARVFRAAGLFLEALLASTSAFFGAGAASAFVSRSPPLAISRSIVAVVSFLGLGFARRTRRSVDPQDPKAVYSFYMRVWALFYASYMCLPLAR